MHVRVTCTTGEFISQQDQSDQKTQLNNNRGQVGFKVRNPNIQHTWIIKQTSLMIISDKMSDRSWLYFFNKREVKLTKVFHFWSVPEVWLSPYLVFILIIRVDAGVVLCWPDVAQRLTENKESVHDSQTHLESVASVKAKCALKRTVDMGHIWVTYFDVSMSVWRNGGT